MRGIQAQHYADHGILALLRGHLDPSIELLKAAANATPDAPDALSSLAVAYLTRAEHQGTAFDVLMGVEAARKAAEIEPERPAFRYNLALALEASGLRRQALSAWDAFLSLPNPEPGWRTEASRRRGRLLAPSHLDLWERAKKLLEHEDLTGTELVDGQSLRGMMSRFPYEMRRYAEEELLARWAAAARNGDHETASRRLNRARSIGSALARQRGEGLLQDAVTAIDHARVHPSWPTYLRLIEGHTRFGRAIDSYDRREYAIAETTFAEAYQALAGAGSPFAGWAAFYHAVCRYYEGVKEAYRDLQSLRDRIDADRNHALNGRIAWMLGTIEAVRRRPSAALEQYRIALAEMEASSGKVRAAFVHVLLAEAYSQIGEVETSWTHRRQALDVLATAGDPRRIHAMLDEAARALLDHGQPALAVPVLDEVVENASAWQVPVALLEGYRKRALARLALGDHIGAQADLHHAQRALKLMPDSGSRRRQHAKLRFVEGLAITDEDPAEAVSAITEAADALAATGYLYDRIEQFTARADAYRRLGHVAMARADYLAAIAVYDKARSQLEGALRLRAFERAQPAFDALIDLALSEGDELAAFDLAERARARFLLDARASADDESARLPLGVREIQPLLAKDTFLVSYAVLPESLVTWVISPDRGLCTTRLNIRRQDLERKIAGLRSAIASYASDEVFLKASGNLYDLLIRPLGLGPQAKHLLLVPDRALHDVAFAALYDRGAQRYLLEVATLQVAPSATLGLVDDTRLRPSVAERMALIIAEPASDPELGLAPLPGARKEGEEIARIYPRNLFLSGTDATPDRFLAEAPRYDVIHVAAHALAKPRAPLRSLLILAPGPDDNGSLSVQDLARRRLPRTEVVVLSACRSSYGEEVGREAVLGLAGGIIASGANTVVASLWDVDDQATAELMPRFHRQLNAGHEPAQALRVAALELLRSGDELLSEPAAWAAFTVIGAVR